MKHSNRQADPGIKPPPTPEQIIPQIQVLSKYPRTFRRAYWKTLALFEDITWTEYCSMESTLKEEASK